MISIGHAQAYHIAGTYETRELGYRNMQDLIAQVPTNSSIHYKQQLLNRLSMLIFLFLIQDRPFSL